MIDRRRWILLAGAGAGRALVGPSLAALGALGACGDNDHQGIHGAVFEVGCDGFIVHVYSSAANRVRVQIDEADGAADSVLDEIIEVESESRVAALLVSDLTAGTRYALRMSPVGEAPSWWLTMRTAPEPSQLEALRFLYSADIDVSPEWRSPIFDAMAAQVDADFFLCLGDWPYADNTPGAWTLDEFRARNADTRADDRVQLLLQSLPAYAIYDDHEIRNNWDGRFRVEESERVEAGLLAWDEFFPLREPSVRYRRVRWGQWCEIFILDTRLYRSANDAPDGPRKTMLGAEQLAWLQASLLESDATFKIIATSVPLDFARIEDHWASFAYERQVLVDFLVDNRVHTVVFLTADQHFFATHHFASGIKEFQTGPLARGLFAEIPPMQPEELNRFNQLNYAEVIIASDTEPRLTLVGRDEVGQELYRETIRPGIGTLVIDSPESREFETVGAHHFCGTAPLRFGYAPVGDYELRWLDGGEGGSGTLEAGGELTLS